jgi:hypothetical protein
MSNEVILSTEDLVAGSYYKIKGYSNMSEFAGKNWSSVKEDDFVIGHVGQYQADGTFHIKGNAKLEMYKDPIIEAYPSKYLFKKITNTMLTDFTNARNAILDL